MPDTRIEKRLELEEKRKKLVDQLAEIDSNIEKVVNEKVTFDTPGSCDVVAAASEDSEEVEDVEEEAPPEPPKDVDESDDEAPPEPPADFSITLE